VLISDYRNLPGKHCGSTAMRNLLYHYCGLELIEEVVFGLGAGVDFLYFTGEAYRPSTLVFGRSVALEQDLAAALGVDYREQVEPDDDEAWRRVRAEVDAGRPTMLSGDALYLDYRDFKVHFPAHRYVLLGYEDDVEVAYIADRLDPEPQRCSYRALRLSRNPPEFISTYNLWGRFFGTEVSRSMEEAYGHALKTNARRMLAEDEAAVAALRAASGDPTVGVAMGLAGMARFAEDLATWHRRDDCGLVARYAADCIEKYGTGGGGVVRPVPRRGSSGPGRARLPDQDPHGLPRQDRRRHGAQAAHPLASRRGGAVRARPAPVRCGPPAETVLRGPWGRPQRDLAGRRAGIL
jgi:hypothetical protein